MFRTPLFSTAAVVFAIGCAAAEPDCADGTCDQRSAAAESDALRTADDGCDGLRAVIDDVSEACATSIEDVIAECRTAVDSLDERCDNAVAGIEAELADARARLGSLQDIYDRAVAAGDRAAAARTAAAIDDVNAELRALLAALDRVEVAISWIKAERSPQPSGSCARAAPHRSASRLVSVRRRFSPAREAACLSA